MSEWSGNILSNEGAVFSAGDIRVHVVRFAEKIIGMRAWVVAVYDSDPFRLDRAPLLEVIVLNVKPDVVRKDAEMLAKWALAAIRKATR